MWWRCFDINIIDELQIFQSFDHNSQISHLHCLAFSIFWSFININMSLIFFINWLWLLEEMLLCT